MRWIALVAAYSAVAPACFAADIELRFAALERIIAAQLFTQDGRHYVRGSQKTRCQFAYLEAPHIDSDQGRLRVRARFSGRSALDLMNRCMGLGDSFDLTITGAPAVHNGAIVLREVNVSTPRDSYYIRRVRAALSQSISKDFKIEVRDQARQLLETRAEATSEPVRKESKESKEPIEFKDPKDFKDPLYKQELAAFALSEVRVTPDSLVLVIDFKLVVK